MADVNGADPLGAADAAWLHMEEKTNPMVVSALLEFGSRLEPPRWQQLIERLVAAAPRFRARVVEPPFGLGVPRFEPDPKFALARHVVRVKLEPGDAALRTYLGRHLGPLTELARHRPLWRIHVIDRPGEGTVLLCRIHHSIADGFALMGLLLSLCDEGAPPRVSAVTHGFTAGSAVRLGAALTRLIVLPPDPKTSLKQPLTLRKRVAWSNPIPLERIKAIARPLSATINDVLVAAVSGALRSHLESHGEAVAQVRAIVPVNLRANGGETEKLGNRFGLVILGLPVGVVDPAARVLEVSRRMGRLKRSPEAVATLGVLQALGRAPRSVEDLGVSFFGSKASLVLTNVPGPRERLHVAGVTLERLVFWVPQSARMGLGVSIFSYAGEVTVGVLSDVAVLKDPQVLVDALEHELDLLDGQSGAAAQPPSKPRPRPRRRAAQKSPARPRSR